jgi:hypothetical protein
VRAKHPDKVLLDGGRPMKAECIATNHADKARRLGIPVRRLGDGGAGTPPFRRFGMANRWLSIDV